MLKIMILTNILIVMNPQIITINIIVELLKTTKETKVKGIATAATKTTVTSIGKQSTTKEKIKKTSVVSALSGRH